MSHPYKLRVSILNEHPVYVKRINAYVENISKNANFEYM